MISQRDINAFFTVLDVLADPDKAREQLTVLQNMRESVDADLKRVGEETQRAQNMLTEARNESASAKLAMARVKEHEDNVGKIEQQQLAKDKKQIEVANQQVEIQRLQDEREERIAAREADYAERIKRYETSLVDFNVRNEALRKKEAEYTERMSKLRSIAN